MEAGARHDVPFRFDVPWQTPITDLYGQRLHGMTMGLATELEVARAVDKSDLDQVAVHPLPAQERILNALLQIGFRFSKADVEKGRIYGVEQHLPFYQGLLPRPSGAHPANNLQRNNTHSGCKRFTVVDVEEHTPDRHELVPPGRGLEMDHLARLLMLR